MSKHTGVYQPTYQRQGDNQGWKEKNRDWKGYGWKDHN